MKILWIEATEVIHHKIGIHITDDNHFRDVYAKDVKNFTLLKGKKIPSESDAFWDVKEYLNLDEDSIKIGHLKDIKVQIKEA